MEDSHEQNTFVKVQKRDTRDEEIGVGKITETFPNREGLRYCVNQMRSRTVVVVSERLRPDRSTIVPSAN